MAQRETGTITRRGFLIMSGAAVAAAGWYDSATAQTLPPAPPVPGEKQLILRSPRPINLETRLADLRGYHIPDELFYVRNNYNVPAVDPAQWTLRIDGEVEQPLVFRLDDLKRMPSLTQDAVLECAGNGRAFHKPRAHNPLGYRWNVIHAVTVNVA